MAVNLLRAAPNKVRARNYILCMYVGMLIAHTNTPLVMALSRRRRGYESKRNEQSQESYEITAQEVAAAQ